MSKRLGSLATIHYGKSPSEVLHEDGPFPIVGTGGVYGKAVRAMFPSAVVVPRKGSLGNPQLVDRPFWPVDTTYAVIPNKKVDLRWLYYNLLLFDLTKLNEATGVPSISRDWLAKIKFYDPGYEQQKVIASILETIDQAIEKTEALIHKSQQIKAGLMHDLFARGLTADGKLRPPREQAPELYQETPIGWIPKEWEILEFENVAQILDPQPDHRTPPEQLDGIPYIGIGDFDLNGDLNTNGCRKIIPKAYEKQRLRFTTEQGDIIFGKIGTIGHPKILPGGRYALSANVLLIKSNVGSSYIFHILNATLFSKQISDITNTTSQPALGIERVRKLLIPVPSDSNEIDKINTLLNACYEKISTNFVYLQKLKKQKSGLMHDLLTGKVPVKIDQEEPTHG